MIYFSPLIRENYLSIGHLRGLCGFAVKAVQEHSDICVTFMFVGGYDDPLQREISRHMPEHGPDLKARIRFVVIIMNLGFTH